MHACVCVCVCMCTCNACMHGCVRAYMRGRACTCKLACLCTAYIIVYWCSHNSFPQTPSHPSKKIFLVEKTKNSCTEQNWPGYLGLEVPQTLNALSISKHQEIPLPCQWGYSGQSTLETQILSTGKSVFCVWNVYTVLSTSNDHFQGSRPEWYISSMIYSRNTPFWSETLDLEISVLCLKGLHGLTYVEWSLGNQCSVSEMSTQSFLC